MKDTKRDGMFFKILIPNIYSTHCTIDTLEITFVDMEGQSFTYTMDSLDFDKYFVNSGQYAISIPGLGQLLEIPIYIDFAKLEATNLRASFNFEDIQTINFAVQDANNWPGSFADYFANDTWAVINFPYQILGVSEMKLYDILANDSELSVHFNDLAFDCVVEQGTTITIDTLDVNFTGIEVYNDNVALNYETDIQYADTIDIYFNMDDKNVPFPLYEMTTSTVGLYDELSDTIMAFSLLEWDNSRDKYHARFMIIEDVKEDDVENYRFKLMFFPTSAEDQVNSTSILSVDLEPLELSKICLKNDREIVVEEDYSFTLHTQFELTYEEILKMNGFILDDTSYWRQREIIQYKATDPIGHTTLCKYTLDVHGLIGDSSIVDTNNFVVEFIDRDDNNQIKKLYEVIDGQSQSCEEGYRIDECKIEYYGYYQTVYPNKFVLKITWDNASLIGYDTQLLISYHVEQGKTIFPETFEDSEDVLTPVNFMKYDYNTWEWTSHDLFDEIINVDPVYENSTSHAFDPDDSWAIVNSSIGSGIIDLMYVWDGTTKINATDYNYEIINENGIDALNVTYKGDIQKSLHIEYKYIPKLKLTHYAIEDMLINSTIEVFSEPGADEYHKIYLEPFVDYNITGTNLNYLMFYTINTSIAPYSYTLEDFFFINYYGALTEEVNLVKNLLLEYINEDGKWIPIAKIPLDPTGSFDTEFLISEDSLPFPINIEHIARLRYLPDTLTDYQGSVNSVSYDFNCVFDTTKPLTEVFTIFVDGKRSKLQYIPTDFSTAVDRFIPIQSREYTTTTNPYETLLEGEPYTYLDLHRTITDEYQFTFQLTDEVDDPLSDQLVWMEIGIKPKAGLDYKLIDWENEAGEYIDAEALGTVSFTKEGEKVYYGPGISGFRSRMYNRPEKFEYQDPVTSEIGTYSSYYWDYQISDEFGLVSFNMSFVDDYIADFERIFAMSMFSSGSITRDSLDDYRLYMRVFHAPIFSAEEMALSDVGDLLCSMNHTVFDESRVGELSEDILDNTAYYDGAYCEGPITFHPEDVLLGVPDLLIYQYGGDNDPTKIHDSFSFDVEIVEADPLPDAAIVTLDRLQNAYNDTVLIPEQQSFYNTSELLYGVPITCTITDYYGNNPFTDDPVFFAYINEQGFTTINISDYFMGQLYPGVFRVNIYAEATPYTKRAYRFCTLEVRPENFLKFGEPTSNLDLIDWYTAGWGSAYIGDEYLFYEDVYPRFIAYFGTLHDTTYNEYLEDYVFINISASYKESGVWSDWIMIGEEIWLSSLKYDGLYYAEVPLGADGAQLMGKEVKLKITADCTDNQDNMTAHERTQGLYIVNMSIVTSNIRNDTVVLYSYYDDTKSDYYYIGDDSADEDEDKWGIERYFTYTSDESTYGLSLADVLLNLFGFGGISVIYVFGKKEYQDEPLDLGTDYSIESDGYTININHGNAALDDSSDLIIGYKLNMSQQYVNYMEFSAQKGFVQSFEIPYEIDLTKTKKEQTYLGNYYTTFVENNSINGNKWVLLNKSFTGIKDSDFEIYNVTDSDNNELLSDIDQAKTKIIDNRINVTFSTTSNEDIVITYGIAAYKLDRGYQLIEGVMSDSVRKASLYEDHNNIIKDYATGSAVDLSLLSIPADSDNPLEVNDPKLLISLPEEKPIELSFEYLPLLYGSMLNGSFYIDDCVLSQVSDEAKPLLVSFTIITEDGEAYFDYMVINASEGDNYYDFKINLQPIYAVKGYTTIDIQISIIGFTNRTDSMQYIFIDKFQLLADDIILKTVDKPATDRRGKYDVELFLNSNHWIQIFTADLKDTYNVPDNSWMTIGVEGFDGFGELKQIIQDQETKEISFTNQGTEYSFKSLAEHDRRLVDSIGFHLDCYDIEEPLYLEGLVSLYKGLGTYYDGSYEVDNEQYAMDWQGADYVVDIKTFDASVYNDQFLLSETPLSTNDYMDVSGSVYMHHRVNISDTNNIITENLPSGVKFAYSIPSSTARIDTIEVESIERICTPYDWVESWQGYSLTEDNFDELSPYNPEAMVYNPSARKLSSNIHYELVLNDTSQCLIYFYEAPENISKILLDSDIIQIDFHISYWFTQNDYDIAEDEYTFNARLYWKFPVAWGSGTEDLYDWTDFAYHPDLNSTATFSATFVKLTDYATKQNYKSTETEEFQFYPREYNFTTFEYEGYNQWVTVNLTYGGEFQNRWEDIKPFGLNVITDEGEEKFLSTEHIEFWQQVGDTQPVFKFKLSNALIQYINITIGSEVLFTYYYLKDTLEYYTNYRDILYGSDKYTMVIKDSQGTEIPKYEVIASVVDNKITFNDEIRTHLAIGQKFTIEYEFKTRGGLIESKHIFIEVQPYEMMFYNSYNILSGGSIIAPLYYNLSSNFNYQLALNYRLMEKEILTYTFEIPSTGDSAEFNLEYNAPMDLGGDPALYAHYYDKEDKRVDIKDQYVNYNFNSHILTISNLDEIRRHMKEGDDIIYLESAVDSLNKYRDYHNFDINLRNDEIILHSWDVADNPQDNLIVNLESEYLVYDIEERSDWAKGKVKQIFATLDESNSLIYYLDEDLDDSENGWQDYRTLIMKIGLLNPYVLDYINVSFYYTDGSGAHFIGSSEITLEMFDDDTGAVYIPLPESNDFDKFKVANDAYIMFTPIFYEADDFEGFFYEEGLPTLQTVVWDSESVVDGKLPLNLEQEAFSTDQKAYVLNLLQEFIYEVDIGTYNQEFSYYDDEDAYELDIHNITLPMYYNDSNGNAIEMRDGQLLYIKYNATFEKSIGLTMEEMALQRDNYLPNYLEGGSDVPVAEIALLGIGANNSDFYYSTLNDLYLNRSELVAWELPLDITPFESAFDDTYKQAVFNII